MEVAFKERTRLICRSVSKPAKQLKLRIALSHPQRPKDGNVVQYLLSNGGMDVESATGCF